MSTWKEIASWAEFRADRLRKDADAAEKIVNTPPAFAFAAALRQAADVMERDAKQWRFNAERKNHKRGG